MSRTPMWRRYLRFRGPDVRADVDDELEFHLEMRTRELMARGMDPAAAHTEALRRFGDVDSVRRECEAVGRDRERIRHRREWVASLLQDLRFGGRVLRRNPSFALIAVLTLGVGIGAATAMFSVLDGVLLRPLPVAEQDRVVVMWAEDPESGFPHFPLTYPMLQAYREQNRAFGRVAAVDYNGAWPKAMQDGDRTVTLRGTWVTGDFFGVLGVVPALGRTLLPEDDVVGAAPTMVISHGFWQRYFGGDSAAVGRAFRWNSKSYTIVGVMPRGFEYPRGAESWTPLVPFFPDMAAPQKEGSWRGELDLVGRLAPGVSVEQARADLDAFFRRTDPQRPAALRGMRAVINPLPELVVGDVRPVLLILAAAVALVLLIACINVANLLFIRGSARVRELAVRAALGAGRGRIARQLITESATLAVLGGLVGVLIAWGMLRGLVALAPPELPRLEVVRLDARVLAFTAATTAVAALLAGLAPALWTAGGSMSGALRGGTRGGTAGKGLLRVRQALVVGQIALALLVLVGAGLLARSLWKLQQVDMGFTRERLVIAAMITPPDRFENREAHLATVEEVLARARAIPGVTAAAPVAAWPFSGPGGWDATYTGAGQSAEERAANPMLNLELAAPEYFGTLGIPIRRGRAFTEQDREGAAPVAIISEAVAERTWPGEDPIGKQIKIGGLDTPMPWHTVVGVVGETRYRELVTPRPTLYLPVRQFGGPVPMGLALRTGADASAVIPAVRHELRAVDPDLLLVDAAPMTQLLSVPLARPRFSTVLLGIFAVIALLLAATGIYGVMTAFVRQRTHEIGVRMALGAEGSDVRRLILRQGLLLAAVGAVVGLAAALAGTRVLGAMLFAVSPTDPLTLAGTSAMLLLAVLVACYFPAHRATRVDPLATLRAD